MEQSCSPQPEWAWDEMLEAFRALGGVAENIRLGDGQTCRGLWAVNMAEPVLLRVPRNLLLAAGDIEFDGDQIRIRPLASVPEAERRFIEKYEAAFSWEADGRTKAAAWITALDGLPAEIRELLIAEFGLGDLLQGDFAERVQTQFLRSRAIPRRAGAVIAPLLELANYGVEGLRCEWGTHLQIQGYVRNEVTLRRDAEDAYSTFCRFGIAQSQPVAFSLPMKLPCETREIVIGRNPNEVVMRGQERIPKTNDDGRALALSYLSIGRKKNPRLPRGTFRSLLREAGVKSSDEAFDMVLNFNALQFIKLLTVLEAHEGEMISLLRTMARYQLEAMNHCVGSRELDPVGYGRVGW
jgi:hypothetical protein